MVPSRHDHLLYNTQSGLTAHVGNFKTLPMQVYGMSHLFPATQLPKQISAFIMYRIPSLHSGLEFGKYG